MTAQEKVDRATVFPASSGTRLPSLTALRIVAATLVYIHHAMYQPVFSDQGLQNAYNELARNLGPLSVMFFFVLSGFILTWSAKPHDPVKQYYRRRFFKIFPNHIAVWVILLLLMFVAGRTVLWPEAVVSLGLLQAWVPDFNYQLLAVNPPTWTLSVELLFYLCFPLLLILVNRIRPSRLWLYAGLAAVAALLMPVVSRLFLPDSPPTPVSASLSWPQLWFIYYFPVARMFEFLVGMVMAKILMTGRWRGVRPLFIVVVLVVAYVATLPLKLFEEGYQAVFLIPLALVITGAAAADLAGRRTLLSSRGMVWLGEISYAFYLVHVTVFFSLQAAFNHQWGLGGMFTSRPFGTVAGITFLVGAYLACVLVAWLVYSLVERPVMRRWARPRRARPAGTSSAVR
ncbi:acyltransferase family protein [Micromonospora sp. NPDC092111]|uniref:acyltransferase family protein n=1 Tax=Micromonospora sp. NPDC092111 TaxID=3364289 RepID=UPI003813A576